MAGRARRQRDHARVARQAASRPTRQAGNHRQRRRQTDRRHHGYVRAAGWGGMNTTMASQEQACDARADTTRRTHVYDIYTDTMRPLTEAEQAAFEPPEGSPLSE